MSQVVQKAQPGQQSPPGGEPIIQGTLDPALTRPQSRQLEPSSPFTTAVSANSTGSPGDLYCRPVMAGTSDGISYHSDVSHGTFQSTISQEKEKLRWDSDAELKKVSKSLLRLQKWSLLTGLLIINGTLIYVGVAYPEAYYLGVILLTANTAFQVFMILCILVTVLWTKVICYPWRRKPKNPETPERMVWLLPCYNENLEELTRSLGSLCAQKRVENNPKFIMIVVDGNVRGPGMTKTTQQYLLQDVLGPGRLVRFENGYRAHDGLFMPVDVQTGLFNGIPYLFVGKRHNMGKRDSLCFARSFLYHFNKRSENTETMFNPQLFDFMGGTLVQSGLETVDYLAGMDADTVFDDLCIHEMLQVLRRQPKLVAVCGHVCVDYAGKNWGAWSLYQGVEYSLTQGLRRTFQSIVTGKVNCLPGCCQLIRVSETTFGDTILRERFGYCPKPNDPMTVQIMGIYSEDSIHATMFFSLFPKSQTAQALRAKAFTIVPQNWKVFLSQRKRWSLGSVSNQFTMVFRPGILLVERILSLVTVITWAITPFTVAAIAHLIVVIVKHGSKLWSDPAFLGLISLLFVKYIYSFGLVFWLPRNNLERAQYIAGYIIHVVAGPFINLAIFLYSLYYSDDFGWGKTREVVPSTNDLEGGHLER